MFCGEPSRDLLCLLVWSCEVVSETLDDDALDGQWPHTPHHASLSMVMKQKQQQQQQPPSQPSPQPFPFVVLEGHSLPVA
ncbi:MAG: hypothetical protein J3Q66DRAFT_103347 [Benniella sp.]|nr:MAG: hypothetical protein J3Q66DRAFT_103347 [Benniella sp.]